MHPYQKRPVRQAEHDEAVPASDGEAKEIMAVATQISERIREWLKTEHQELM